MGIPTTNIWKWHILAACSENICGNQPPAETSALARHRVQRKIAKPCRASFKIYSFWAAEQSGAERGWARGMPQFFW